MPKVRNSLINLLSFFICFFLVGPVFAGGGGGANLGETLALWTIVPFVGILLSIALFPLAAPHFWHSHYGKISAFWGLLFGIPFLIAHTGAAFHEILHIMFLDYIPFIILLWGLFTASGGIVLRGTLLGTPKMNTFILLIGTTLASVIGTTGASMLLIRPLIRANKFRNYQVHIVVFFIFLVSNIGGSLTPIGDPPLFLGFLHGVPFSWTLIKMAPLMIATSVPLLIIFYILDSYLVKKETMPPIEKTDVTVVGLNNFIFLAGIIAAVLLSGMWKPGDVHFLGIHLGIQNIVRDVLIIVMGLLSLKFTSQQLRDENFFTWEPILEVAKLFAGIFICIIPALAILKAGDKGSLAFIVKFAEGEANYFWLTGILSSFLDNAPTYLTFFNTALGQLGLTEAQITEGLRAASMSPLVAQFDSLLLAISAGAVFMGANTYIGNAPNFMTKAIAEENNIKMPSFFGYMAWSVLILCPLFVMVTYIFF